MEDKELRDNVEHCPHCNANLQGQEASKEDQLLIGATHFSRKIGIYGGMMGIYDGIIAWVCPDCKEEYPIGNSEWAKEMFERYQNDKNKGEE